MQEETDSDFVHLERFGKRQGFANETAQALAEGIVETPNVIRGDPLGVAGVMLVGGQDVVVALQVVGIKRTPAVSQRDAIPKEPGDSIIARTQRVSDDLAGTPTQGQPQPDHPEPTRAANSGLFLSHADTVLRDTLKMRVKPRKEARS